LHLGIDCVVEAFNRVGARGHPAEGGVHLRHVLEIDGDVPLRQLRWTEAELAAGDAIPGYRALTFQMVEIGIGALGELGIADPVLEIEPDMVDVHRLSPLDPTALARPHRRSMVQRARTSTIPRPVSCDLEHDGNDEISEVNARTR